MNFACYWTKQLKVSSILWIQKVLVYLSFRLVSLFCLIIAFSVSLFDKQRLSHGRLRSLLNLSAKCIITILSLDRAFVSLSFTFKGKTCR